MRADRSSPLDAAEVDVAIIGSGFAGLGMAIQLQRKGRENFLVLEKAGSVGGVWRDNRYPGCACDVPSHLYSYSFEPNPDWSRSYSAQPEIESYLQHCACKYAVLPKIRFRSQLVRAVFDERAACWRLWVADTVVLQKYLSDHGVKPGARLDLDVPDFPPLSELRTRVLVSGMGSLSTPVLPDILGLDRFRGRVFHSQAWPREAGLAGKAVAVIGTGASSIQLVPQLQKVVTRLDLYQRTPPWILPKHDRPIGRFERSLFKCVPLIQRLLRVAAYWQAEATVVGFLGLQALIRVVQRQARQHLHRQVANPALRRALTPNYQLGCKRVLISNDFYPALEQDNVALITDGIKKVTERGIVDRQGVERPVDAIVLSTGFQATAFVRAGMVVGTAGRELSEVWSEGAEAYKGATVSGFPNFFMLVGPNVTLAHNSMIYMIEAQIQYVLDAIAQMAKRGIVTADVRPAAQQAYNLKLQGELKKTIWNTGGCQSWYLDSRGRNVTLWSGSTWRFRHSTRRFDLESYALTPQCPKPDPTT